MESDGIAIASSSRTCSGPKLDAPFKRGHGVRCRDWLIAPITRKAGLSPRAAMIQKLQDDKLFITYVPRCTGTTQIEFGMVNKLLMGAIRTR